MKYSVFSLTFLLCFFSTQILSSEKFYLPLDKALPFQFDKRDSSEMSLSFQQQLAQQQLAQQQLAQQQSLDLTESKLFFIGQELNLAKHKLSLAEQELNRQKQAMYCRQEELYKQQRESLQGSGGMTTPQLQTAHGRGGPSRSSTVAPSASSQPASILAFPGVDPILNGLVTAGRGGEKVAPPISDSENRTAALLAALSSGEIHDAAAQGVTNPSLNQDLFHQFGQSGASAGRLNLLPPAGIAMVTDVVHGLPLLDIDSDPEGLNPLSVSAIAMVTNVGDSEHNPNGDTESTKEVVQEQGKKMGSTGVVGLEGMDFYITNDFRCMYPGCKRNGKPSKRFRDAKKHYIAAHTGVKPYSCRTGCKSRFADSSVRSRHEAIHRLNIPFECPDNGCNNKYRQLRSVIRHIKRDHDANQKLINLYREMLKSNTKK